MIARQLINAMIIYGAFSPKESADSPLIKGPVVNPIPVKISTNPILIPILPFGAIFEAIERANGMNMPVDKPNIIMKSMKYIKPPG